eukprot:Phypoly_transcript_04264.p1 GENE.Phypoly_transcript_04264~~Phypoly_transcript_04264.p1  ORF type:complete len:644 (+),score=82.58 Phypoly_transcript_04264:225-2156(+)
MLLVHALSILLVFHCLAHGAVILDGAQKERTFDGIGGLSAGASSAFLRAYPEPYISEILDYLFLPNFAASLQILKVEIGGDVQSTDGTEASHMHTRDDLNYERGYEWWLMVEAKKRNPDIVLYALSWSVPGWIGNGTFFSQDNIDYHIKWLEGAKHVYGLDIDYMGIWNERAYDVEWIEQFRAALNSSGFENTAIVAHDQGWDLVPDMQTDPQFMESIKVVGVHYPGTTSPTNALLLGIPLWSAEDYSTYSDSTGGGCWARLLNQNYVNGFMTSTISWSLIASYYDALPFPGCGLMIAQSPWSGHYDIPSPIWVSAHTTQFTQPGWIYLAHGSGTGILPHGGSYVTLVPPDGSGDFSLIIETMTQNHSACIRPILDHYFVEPQNVTFQLEGGLATNKPLYVWYTHLEQSQENTYFEMIEKIMPVNGRFTISLDLDSVFTVSTLTGQQKGSHPTPPPDAPFPAAFSDDFESYPIGSEAKYFQDQAGVWEIYKGNESLVMRQSVIQPPILWCGESFQPISLFGNSSNTIISVDTLIENQGTVGLGLRVQTGGCFENYANGYFFSISDRGQWNLSNGTTPIKQGVTGFSANKFFRLGLSAVVNTICAFINGANIACMEDLTFSTGFAAIGSGWNYAQFDNVTYENW